METGVVDHDVSSLGRRVVSSVHPMCGVVALVIRGRRGLGITEERRIASHRARAEDGWFDLQMDDDIEAPTRLWPLQEHAVEEEQRRSARVFDRRA